MRLPILLLTIVLAGLWACDQPPEQVYTPPVLGGKAYVLTAANHIAVVDLSTTALTRISMDKKGVDLAIMGQDLFILAEDGSVATLTDENTLTPWQNGLSGALAMTKGHDNNSLWLLGPNELRQFTPGKGPGKAIPLNGSYSSLFLGAEPDSVWLVNRKESSLTPLNLVTGQSGTAIAKIGNSVHQGEVFHGTTEIWLAEGNEYLDGEPYGVGYATGKPAMPGGINVFDVQDKAMTDFIIVGGNVIDLTIAPDRTKVYTAASQLPDYNEATLSLVDAKSRRITAEFRLCYSCHQQADVTLEKGEGQVRAVAIAWPEATQ